MDTARKFFDTLSNWMTAVINHEYTGFFLVLGLLVIGSFCWYCHIFDDPDDPDSTCYTWKTAAVWTNFLTVLLAAFVIGRSKIYPELKNSNPLDKFKSKFNFTS